MRRSSKKGFTLIEVLIVIVIMAILAAAIVPQFTDASQDAKVATAIHNLKTLRTQIRLYQAQHNGDAPATLEVLTQITDATGAVVADGYGPYLDAVPENAINGSNTVVGPIAGPANATQVTEAGGWVYFNEAGDVRLDNADYFEY